MKNFEEWWKKLLCSNDDTLKYMSKEAWKAALEWVLKNLEEEFELSVSGDTGWSGGFIEWELKEDD